MSGPFHGTYVPQQSLSVLDGLNVNGTWTLRVQDLNDDGLHGQVLWWQIIPTTGLILNQTNSYTDFTFDRKIDLSSINASNVVNLLGPTGPVPFSDTITFNANGNVTLAYNGKLAASPAFNFTAGSTTATQLATYLASLPGLGALTASAVTGGSGGIFTVTFPATEYGGSLLTVSSGPATITPLVSITANPTNDTVTFGGSGNVTLAYNGRQATTATFSYTAGTTSASQFAAYLATIPGLSLLTAADVTGPNGGPFVVSLPVGTSLTVAAGSATITQTPVYPSEFTDRVFRINFPTQQYSGSYSVVVGPVNNSVNTALNKPINDTHGNAIDNNLNAGLYVLRGADPTNAATLTNSYSSGVINQTFAAGGAAFSSIFIPDDYIITQDDISHIQLQLILTHQNTPDLVATLTAPDNTVFTLFTNVGISGASKGSPHPDNGSITTLDDFATNTIQSAAVGIAGSYKPQFPLSGLVGKNAKGTWSLTIKNQVKNTANPYSIGTFTGTLNRWTLTLPHSIPGTGLGETGADQVNVGFRIFTESPTNNLSSSVWTAIGPAPENGTQTGPVGAVTVDPADSTGNTVYAAGISGGIWKTYNFLTTSPKGPNWIPLTDLGPLGSLNINTMTAVASTDGDPNKTIVMAGTGSAVANIANSNGLPVRRSGIGFLRSIDGGRTWQVIDSTKNNVNVDPVTQVQSATPISSLQRDHLFDGTAINKIVVDSNPVNGVFIMYAAISGSTATNSGLFRSTDSGLTWSQIESGLCTDVVLAGGSGATGGTGPLQVLYAGFMTGLGRTGGVYFTSSASGAPLGQSSLLPVPNDGAGAPGPNQGLNSRVNIDGLNNPVPLSPYPVIFVGPSPNPSGTTTPIILATPAKTNHPLQDALYQGWVYAYTGGFLYETKDFGNNWTRVALPITPQNINPAGFPTNDTTRGNFGFTAAKSIVIDPSNPNIVYIAGNNPLSFQNLGFNSGSQASSVVRVDLTSVSDVYSNVSYDYSAALNPFAANGAQSFSVGSVNELQSDGSPYLSGNPPTTQLPGPGGVLNDFTGLLEAGNVLSMLRDPMNPFLAPSSLQFTQTLSFRNDGSDIHWQFFDFGEGSVNQMVDIVDPVTGNVRLFSATSSGIYTGVDMPSGNNVPTLTNPTGNIDQGIGTQASINGSRIGNLQVAQITSTGAEPSTLAASVAGALLIAENPGIGTPMSDPNIFQDGNISWNNLSSGFGEQVIADPTGSGTLFRYQYPYTANYAVAPGGVGPNFIGSDFFQVTPPGQTTSSATSGLILAGDFPATTGAGEWPGPGISPIGQTWVTPQPFNNANRGSDFAINPIGIPGDYQGMVISSRTGRIFRSSNSSLAAGVAGITWHAIGDPTVLDGTYAPALAFGPAQGGIVNVDNFIYAGTLGGNIFVTFSGGGTSWTRISTGLDGSAVLAISPDPRVGTHDVFAMTQRAVYYCADSSVATPTWIRLNDVAGKGFIFGANGIQRPVWNNSSDLVAAFNATTGLTTMAVDWRFAVPNTQSPTGTTPVLYLGGDGGVVNSTDFGKTWTIFPAFSTTNSATQSGGFLPAVRVTNLQLVLGNVNQVTGVPDTSTGLNMLVASTLGRGDFAIRLNTSAYSSNVVIPNPGPQVAGITPLTATFGETLSGITVTFKGGVDPTSFTPNSISYVKDPNNKIVPVQYVFDVTPDTGSGNLHNVYQIVFATPQTVAGSYTLLLGPNITDDSGNLMNQNGNTINGQIGTIGSDDRFQGTVAFVPATPPVIGSIPTQIKAPGASFTVTFTVSDAQFAPSSLTLTPAPTSSNTTLVPNANIVVGPANGGQRTLTITPVGNQPGFTFITVNLTDPNGLMAAPVTFEVIFDNVPTITPANPPAQTIAHGHTLLFPFTVGNSLVSPPTATAVTISPIYNLWTLDKFFQSGGSYYQNGAGFNEKWVMSQTTGKWFIIQPDGTLSVWNGGKSFTPITSDGAGHTLVLDNSYWQDPTKITAPAVPFSFSTGIIGNGPNFTLLVTPNLNYVGLATVTLTASDSIASSKITFPLTVTNVAPQFNTIGSATVTGGIPVLNVPPSQAAIVIHMTGVGGYNLVDQDDGAAGVTLNPSAVYAYNTASIAYELSQAYSLYFTGSYFPNSAGLNEKWVAQPDDRAMVRHSALRLV